MKVKWSGNTEKTSFIVFSSLLMLYLVLRAIFVPITHDEVGTFFFYVQSGKFLPFSSHMATNNHFLNSALTFFSYQLLGSSKFVLRLPNILLAILLLFYTYKLGQLIKDRFLRWVFILSILLAHNFIEFLALSRGYGMSMAFLIGGVYYLMMAQQSNNSKHFFFCFLFAILSMSSNLTLIISSLIIISLAVISYFSTKTIKRKNLIMFILLTFFLGIIPILFFVWVSFDYQSKGLLLHGTTEGFWQITVESIIELVAGFNYRFVGLLSLLYFLIICGILIFSLIKIRSRRLLNNNNLTFTWLLISNILASFLLAEFLNVNYLEDRTGLYFYPLFIGSIIFMLSYLQNEIKFKYIKILSIPILLIPVHFLFHINLNFVANHKYEILPERFYHEIKSTFKPGILSPTVSGHGLKSYCWSYINYREGGMLNQMQTAVYPNNLTDYQIVHVSHNPEWLKDYEIIDSEKSIMLSLLRRKKFLKREFIKTMDSINTQTYTNKESFLLCDDIVDTLIGQNIYIDFDLSILCQHSPFFANIVVSLRNTNNENIYFEAIELNKKRLHWNGLKSNFRGSYLLPINDDAYRLFVYLFNKKLQSYLIYDGKITISKAVGTVY